MFLRSSLYNVISHRVTILLNVPIYQLFNCFLLFTLYNYRYRFFSPTSYNILVSRTLALIFFCMRSQGCLFNIRLCFPFNQSVKYDFYTEYRYREKEKKIGIFLKTTTGRNRRRINCVLYYKLTVYILSIYIYI